MGHRLRAVGRSSVCGSSRVGSTHFEEDEWTKCGLVHDLPSFLSLYLSVMHENKQLVVNLETGADETGCIGRYPSTWIGLWGDGMDGTGKHKSLSQAGIVLIDVDHDLIRDGTYNHHQVEEQ